MNKTFMKEGKLGIIICVEQEKKEKEEGVKKTVFSEENEEKAVLWTLRKEVADTGESFKEVMKYENVKVNISAGEEFTWTSRGGIP